MALVMNYMGEPMTIGHYTKLHLSIINRLITAGSWVVSPHLRSKSRFYMLRLYDIRLYILEIACPYSLQWFATYIITLSSITDFQFKGLDLYYPKKDI